MSDDSNNDNNATTLLSYSIINSPVSAIANNVTSNPVSFTTFGVTVVKDDTKEENPFKYEYVLVPLGALVFIAVFTFVVIMILRKSKMDKLRHHLMPLYNFDPAEEEGDWENELLEEDKEQQVALNYNARSPLGGPQLKFHHMDRIV